jgi:hypothetical protein
LDAPLALAVPEETSATPPNSTIPVKMIAAALSRDHRPREHFIGSNIPILLQLGQ